MSEALDSKKIQDRHSQTSRKVWGPDDVYYVCTQCGEQVHEGSKCETYRLAAALREAHQRLERLERVIRKHYPMIAGSVIHYDKLGEKNAADAWNEVAKDFHAALLAESKQP